MEEVDIEKHQELIDKLSKYNKKKMEVNEGKEENEFNVSANEKITMNDLLKSVNNESEYSGLRKTMERIVRARKKRRVEPPKPKYEHAKELRKTQLEETIKDVSEWQPIVKEMRESHQLNFPLDKSQPISLTNNNLTHSFNPSTPMEQEINKILEISNVNEKKNYGR